MADKKKEAENKTESTPKAYDRNTRYWTVPSKRAQAYAADRKARAHTYGPKEDQPLTDFEAGMRTGYLQAQSDHAGIYKYKKALSEGKTKEEAVVISRQKGKK